MEAVKEIFKSGAVISMTVLLVVLVAFVFVAVGPSFIVIEEDTIQELVVTDTNTGVTTVVDPLAEDYELPDPSSGEVEALDDSNIIEFLFIDPETEKPVITAFQVEGLTFANPESEGSTTVPANCVITSGDSSRATWPLPSAVCPIPCLRKPACTTPGPPQCGRSHGPV